jgi:hypothetical protein
MTMNDKHRYVVGVNVTINGVAAPVPFCFVDRRRTQKEFF